uniref:hypothetical protein n=1 Tax=Anaeromyxobacter oryzisoli TaxID=2925408 RepID=UPI001F55AF14
MDRPALAVLAAALLAPAPSRAGDAAPAPSAPSARGAAPLSVTPPPRATPAPPKPADPAKKGDDPQKPPPPRGTVLEDVTGTVHGVDRRAHRIEIDTASGRVALTLDRNTLVYGPRGLVTPLDVQPGATVRAGRNADFLAYWIAVRAADPAAASAPGGGASGKSGPPPEREGGAAGAAP